jgi:hypothetical protein
MSRVGHLVNRWTRDSLLREQLLELGKFGRTKEAVDGGVGWGVDGGVDGDALHIMLFCSLSRFAEKGTNAHEYFLDVPGGEVDPTVCETHFLEAAVRELWEETRIDVTASPAFTVLFTDTDTDTARDRDREPIWRMEEWRPKCGTNCRGWSGACDEVLFFVRYAPLV